MESDLAIIDKRRPRANVAEVMNVIGEVAGRTCVIMDDMVDTAGTLVKAAQVLKEEGATKVVAYCTHAVLSGGAVERIASSDLDELVVTPSGLKGLTVVSNELVADSDPSAEWAETELKAARLLALAGATSERMPFAAAAP